MGLDEPKEAADIGRAEEHGGHQGRIGTSKTGQCWRNRQKIGKDREDIEIKNNKLIKKKPDRHYPGLNRSDYVGVVETEGK